MITPKRTIHSNIKIERERRLPISGTSLTQIGKKVSCDSELLTAEIKGEIAIIRLAEKFGIDPESILDGLKVKVGDKVSAGDLIFYRKGFFKFLTLEDYSDLNGTVEFISEESGHVGIRLSSKKLTLNAFIPGEVTEISKNRSVMLLSHVGLLQGVVGYGGEAIGKIRFFDV